nr:M6 family metalloprotease domain-containing protein [Gemmatimonadota bacterium]
MMRWHAAAAAILFSPAPLTAQQIESLPSATRTLPSAVQRQLRMTPDSLQFRGGWEAKLTRAQAAGSLVSGTLPLVVIPTLFADSDPPSEEIATSALQARLFAEFSPATVTAYYREASLGKLTINGKVTDWVETSFRRSDAVGKTFGLGDDARIREWLREAVANVDASIDFGRFDNDGPDGVPNSGDDDGRVDGAAFLFREIDAACGGNGVWPHRWRLSDGTAPGAVTDDRAPNGRLIVVDDYMTLGARNCSGTRALDVNIFAHETGHVLGLPDYYDASSGILREQRRWVVGCWDIMSGGAWGCGTGPHPAVVNPPHFGPHPKTIMGWITPRIVVAEMRPVQYELRPAHSSGDALRIPLSSSEYLLVEYRAQQGFDAALPGAGVVVYHVETGRQFLPCPACPRRYSYALLEADGDSALTRIETAGGNRGQASDAFGPTRTRIDDTTIPSTRLNDGGSTWVRLS